MKFNSISHTVEQKILTLSEQRPAHCLTENYYQIYSRSVVKSYKTELRCDFIEAYTSAKTDPLILIIHAVLPSFPLLAFACR